MLRIEGLFAGYGAGDILKGVDLQLDPGTITCIIGPNGAGKSTVLKTISGLLKPRAGSIALGDGPIAGLSPRAVLERGIVHVPQERSLFPLMSVWDNLLLGAHLLRDRREVRHRAEALAERFPIVAARRAERAGSLSGGQQKIVELARAMMVQPQLILMDEPSMGLDPKARHAVFETVTSLNQEGQTVLLVEQNARAGLQIADRGVVMDVGRVALNAAARDLLDDPKVAALYLGGTPQRSAPRLDA